MLNLSGVGTRLRDERLRLKMNQTVFGSAVGLSRGTQKAYELGKNCPDIRYLDAVQTLGVDVIYVLTGSRGAVDPGELAPAELALLQDYRRLADDQRKHTSTMVHALAEMAGRYDTSGPE